MTCFVKPGYHRQELMNSVGEAEMVFRMKEGLDLSVNDRDDVLVALGDPLAALPQRKLTQVGC